MTPDTTTDDDSDDEQPAERALDADETIDPNQVELNENKLWYNRGYKLGANEARAERTPTAILAVLLTAGVTAVEPGYGIVLALILAAARWYEHRGWTYTADEERESHDPGDRYLWGGDGD